MKLMRLCPLILMLLFSQSVTAFGLHSHGITSEDSLAVSLHLTDSLGNPSLTHADSFYVSVIGPSGDSIITRSGIAATAGLNIDSLNTRTVGWKYIFANAVADLYGPGRPGVYELVFCIKDADPVYVNCLRTTFQVADYTLNERFTALENILDSLYAALDSLQNQDDWVSSFDPTTDMVEADIRKISGDAPAADAMESVYDGTGGAEVRYGRVVIGGSNGTESSLHVYNTDGPAGEFMSSGQTPLSWALGLQAIDGPGLFAGTIGDGEDIKCGGSGRIIANIHGAVTPTDTSQSGTIIGGTDTTAIISAATNHPDIFFGPTASGSGPDEITIYAVDTSGPDIAVTGVTIGVKTLAGGDYAVGTTSSTGRFTFTAQAPDTFLITGNATGYLWYGLATSGTDTLIVAGNHIDTLSGYDITVDPPAAANLCRVYGYIHAIDGAPIDSVIVEARLDESGIRYVSTIISPYRIVTTTDAAGYFYFDLLPSTELTPAGAKYVISATYGPGIVLKKKITVPASPTWQITW